ncbi:MAG: M20/M25/M40 family metallo-hydrolase [Bacteroidia bacterium]|nr:M20/M25/M40 family metallo-hydrolase [Bacteroidia bacterium]
MKLITLIIITVYLSISAAAQQNEPDSVVLKKVFDEALTDHSAWENLRYLTCTIGPRICGSPQAAAAVEWSKQVLQELNPDTVWLQGLKVKNWKRGDKEYGAITSSKFGFRQVNIAALGLSSPTPENGIVAEVVEVHDFDELAKLGKEKVAGKIVFFNRAMDPVNYYTFASYGGAVNQRVSGASEAAKYDAAGVIVRSVASSEDEFPHTGSMHYAKEDKLKLPVAAICTRDADLLGKWLKDDPHLVFYYKMTCRTLPDADSYNVIGEIRGSEHPDEMITIGGHLDSWDIAPGAHDDGAGVVQSIEIIRLLKKLNIKPKHTIRVVLFMDEEMAQRGAAKYSEEALRKHEKHLAAIESDRGGFAPTGFSVDAAKEQLDKIKSWKNNFEKYGIHEFYAGGSGVDIGPLKDQHVPLIALVTESQRYFDYHHSANDTFDKVNMRELQLGSAAMAFLVLMIDKYGL